MKLYMHPLSPNARRARMTALLTKTAVEEITVDLSKGAQRAPEFLAINPNGKVPVLVDGELTLWESNTISRYLCLKAGNTDLWPTDAAGQAQVSRWMDWQLSTWSPPIGALLFENMFRAMQGRGEPDAARVESSEKELHTAARILDAHLAKNEWLALGRVTLADLAMAPPLAYMVPGKLPLEDYAHIKAWFERVQALPAWQETAPKF